MLPGPQRKRAIHDYVRDTDRVLVRVIKARTVRHGIRIEGNNIGKRAHAEHAAIFDTKLLRGHPGHLVDRRLERERLRVSYVVTEKPGEGAVPAWVR